MNEEYQVTITEATRHGKGNAHRFIFESGHWWAWNPPRHRKLQKHRKQLIDSGRGVVHNGDLIISGRPDQQPRRPRRPDVLNSTDQPLDKYTETVHLGKDFGVKPSTLVTILDALRASDTHRELDVDGIKRVVSKLGSRIAMLDQLNSEALREHAEQALYTQILQALY